MMRSTRNSPCYLQCCRIHASGTSTRNWLTKWITWNQVLPGYEKHGICRTWVSATNRYNRMLVTMLQRTWSLRQVWLYRNHSLLRKHWGIFCVWWIVHAAVYEHPSLSVGSSMSSLERGLCDNKWCCPNHSAVKTLKTIPICFRERVKAHRVQFVNDSWVWYN